jgi:FtsH-binding integral membrane protein
MKSTNKLNKLLTTHRGPGEIQDWLFSLTPIGVAFVFYIVFIMSSAVEPKGLYIAFGAAASFIGLESYWVVRGWQKNHASTVIMGAIGIVITVFVLRFYMSII